MRSSVTVMGGFSASHIVDGHSVCGRLHGHDWKVGATVSGAIHPKTGMVVDHGELYASFGRILDELNGRHLNDMLLGVVPTPEGIAAYVRERMLMAFPNVTKVTVAIDPMRAEVEWDLR